MCSLFPMLSFPICGGDLDILSGVSGVLVLSGIEQGDNTSAASTDAAVDLRDWKFHCDLLRAWGLHTWRLCGEPR